MGRVFMSSSTKPTTWVSPGSVPAGLLFHCNCTFLLLCTMVHFLLIARLHEFSLVAKYFCVLISIYSWTCSCKPQTKLLGFHRSVQPLSPIRQISRRGEGKGRDRSLLCGTGRQHFSSSLVIFGVQTWGFALNRGRIQGRGWKVCTANSPSHR
jgi:hypothetical protein